MEHELKVSWIEAVQIKFSAEEQIKDYTKLIELAEKDEELRKPEYTNYRKNLKYYLELWKNILEKSKTIVENN